MADIDQVLQDVTDEATLIGGISTLIQGLKDQIKNLGIPPEVQAKIDQVFAQAEANKQGLTDALTANTQQTPPLP